MKSSTPHLLIAAACLLTSTMYAEQESNVTQIFSETEYTYNAPKWWGLSDKEGRVSKSGKGTAFLVQFEGKNYLVSAGHVAAQPAIPEEILFDDDDDEKRIAGDNITASEYRIRLSGLSIRPEQIAFDTENDLVAMTVDPTELDSLNMKAFVLSEDQPDTGETVSLWGFPGTNEQHLYDSMRISDSRGNYFVLNKSVAPGASGGPIIGRNTRVLGLAVRATGKQTRCVNATHIAGPSSERSRG